MSFRKGREELRHKKRGQTGSIFRIWGNKKDTANSAVFFVLEMVKGVEKNPDTNNAAKPAAFFVFGWFCER